MTYEKIQEQLYKQRLKNERERRTWEQSVIVPKGHEQINLLPISNLFFGNDVYPPRIEMLVQDIEAVNNDPCGAFFLGGNLFYYPAGQTDLKAQRVEKMADALATILSKMDTKKVILAYDGVNEESLKNDRTLKYPIESTKILCDYLGISNRYFAGTKVELDFIFNNALTEGNDAVMSGIFTSLRPISATRAAIIAKFNKNLSMNREKTFAIDTSSAFEIFLQKQNIAKLNERLTQFYESYWISPAGYTDQPQKLRKDSLYNINHKIIQLKVEPQIRELLPTNLRTEDTTLYSSLKKKVSVLTIGVDSDKFYDPGIMAELNTEIFLNEMLKEAIAQEFEKQLNEHRNKNLTSLHQKQAKQKEQEKDSKLTTETDGIYKFE